ncbi:MAG: outer membrane beta-barrel protein [Pseudomonadota bacterium]
MRLIGIACLMALILPLPLAAAPAGTVDFDQWRPQQNDNHYIIQLTAVSKESRLPSDQAVSEVKSVNPELDVVYQRKLVKGKTWHALLWGPFDSPARAQQANRGLPGSLHNDSPWVRRIGQLPAGNASASAAAAPASSSGGDGNGDNLEASLAAMLLGKEAASSGGGDNTPTPKPKPQQNRQQTLSTEGLSDRPPVRGDETRDPRDPRATSRRLDTRGMESAPRVQRGGNRYEGKFVMPKGNYQRKDLLKMYGSEDDFEDMTGIDTYIPRQGVYPYARFNAGQLTTETGAQQDVLGGGVTLEDEATGNALELALGLDVGYYLAVELGYLQANGVEADFSDGQTLSTDLTGLKYSGMLKLPIDGKLYRQWIPYAQVGLLDWEAETEAVTAGGANIGGGKTDDSHMFYTLGLDYKLNRHWAIGLSASEYDFDEPTQSIQLGVTWRWQGRN